MPKEFWYKILFDFLIVFAILFAVQTTMGPYTSKMVRFVVSMILILAYFGFFRQMFLT